MLNNLIRVLKVFGVVPLLTPPALACTAAVILGSATDDGRPLLWKNRDTDDRRNEIVHFAPREIDGRMSQAFIAVTNAGDALPLSLIHI